MYEREINEINASWNRKEQSMHVVRIVKHAYAQKFSRQFKGIVM